MTWSEIARQIIARAGNRCEYCRMHQSLQGATFHVEHIVPQSAGGSSDMENLALACPGCNLKKSNRLKVRSVDGNELKMFDPRLDSWSEHFTWNGDKSDGPTPLGNAMIHAFDLNHPRRRRVRQAEALFGLFPPEASQFVAPDCFSFTYR